jgi:hypothetical protein
VFIRKILHVLQDSDLSIYGLGDMGYAKVWEKIYIWTYEGPRKRKNGDTWRSQGIEKNDEHMKAHIKNEKNEWW